jgi:hypothetical protein
MAATPGNLAAPRQRVRHRLKKIRLAALHGVELVGRRSLGQNDLEFVETEVARDAWLIENALKVGATIAAMSVPVGKESVNRVYKATLAEGVRFGRCLFQLFLR